MKNKFKKLFFELVLLYAITFPTSGLIKELNEHSNPPEDWDEHMFI